MAISFIRLPSNSLGLLTVRFSTPKVLKIKIFDFANSIDQDEAAHNEQPHLDLCCLPSSFQVVNMIYEGISKSFEPNMERARNLDLFCFIFQRSPLPTPHTCPI